MNLGTAQVIQGDARHLPLADDSVDLVVTSPPYFALRSYQDGGEHYSGQLGSEGTPAEFVAALLEVTRECVRVLKPSGSLWVNLGDKYAGSPAGNAVPSGKHAGNTGALAQMSSAPRRPHPGVATKSLMGIPWRYALACIDDLGLILRAELIWSKPNGLPESVTDRVRRSHEQWFHFTLEPRYFSAVDEIREAHSDNSHARRTMGRPTPKQTAGLGLDVRRGYMAETAPTRWASSPAPSGPSQPNPSKSPTTSASTTSPPSPPNGPDASSKAGHRPAYASNAAKDDGRSNTRRRTSITAPGRSGAAPNR
jgi:SAM-dependent methyltransferase